jgi:hypothetical protein
MVSLPSALFFKSSEDQPFFARFVKGLAAQCSHGLRGVGLRSVAFFNRAVRKWRTHGLFACETAAIMACLHLLI